MIYKRGKAYSYNFRWSIRHEDGTVENFRIRQSAKTHKRKEAEDAENEHKRALRLGEIHPNDPWPKPAASAPPVFRAFAKEFLQYAKTHTKPGTQTFYGVCLDRLSTFAAIADAPLDAITGDVVSRYARHRQEGAEEFRNHRERRSTHVAAGSASCVGVGLAGPRTSDLRIATGPGPGSRVAELCGRGKVSGEGFRESPGCNDSGRRYRDATKQRIVPPEMGRCGPNGAPRVPARGDSRSPASKTDSAQRSLPLTPRAAEVLQRRKRAGEAKPSPFVFAGAGISGHITSVQHPHKAAIEDAKLESFEFYCWRHTFGTRAAQSGMDRFTLARLMGHSSPSVAARYYVHVTETHVAAGFGKFVEYQTRNVAEGLAAAFPQASGAVQ